MIGSVTGLHAGSSVAVGSGNCSMQRDDGWLVSGLGVGLKISSSVGQTEKYSPLFSSTHSTNAAKLSLVRWKVCLQPLAQAGVVKYTERAIRVMSQAREM